MASRATSSVINRFGANKEEEATCVRVVVRVKEAWAILADLKVKVNHRLQVHKVMVLKVQDLVAKVKVHLQGRDNRKEPAMADGSVTGCTGTEGNIEGEGRTSRRIRQQIPLGSDRLIWQFSTCPNVMLLLSIRILD